MKKPSEKEEEFFARQEFERRKKIEEEKYQKMAEEERKKFKELHFMKCPKCGMDLVEIDYKNIKVDKCAHCGGLWLDIGELDALFNLEKSIFNKVLSVFK